MYKYKIGTETLTEQELRRRFYYVSFPMVIKADELPEGVTQVEVTEQPYTPTLSELKRQKQNEIAAAFNSHTSGSFTCSLGFPLQFSETDVMKMEGAIKLIEAQRLTSGYITDAEDNTHYNIPLTRIKEAQLEMLYEYAKAHQKKQELRAAIEAAQTPEELEAITWHSMTSEKQE